MILLIDIGNSLTKVALADLTKEKITLLKPIASKNDNWNQDIKQLMTKVKNKVNDIIISSVVPNKTIEISKIIKIILKIKAIIINPDLITALTFPLQLNLTTNKIGNDMLTLAIASHNKYHNCIVVSLGTATTYTIINDDMLSGVIIGPGFTNAKKSLTTDAALIKPFTVKPYSSILGNTTSHALSIGYGNGFNYMIAGTIKAINQELQTNLPVVITGGNFQELKPFFHFEYQYDEDILLYGLMIIYQNYQKNNKLKS